MKTSASKTAQFHALADLKWYTSFICTFKIVVLFYGHLFLDSHLSSASVPKQLSADDSSPKLRCLPVPTQNHWSLIRNSTELAS